MAKSADTAAAPSGKKKLLLIVAAVLVLVLGGGAAAYFLGLFGSTSHAEAATPHEAPAYEGEVEHGAAPATPAVTVVFVDLPDMIVNLQSSGSRMRYLKLRLALEVADEATAQMVKTLTPRILDSFQLYLRALTVEDLAGSAGMQRLKEDLIARSNLAAEPVHIADVLLKEMLVQ